MPTAASQNKSALLFVPNQGQTDEKARFIARVSGHQFYFTQSGIAAVSYARAEGETVDKRVTMRDPKNKRAAVSDAPMRGAALFLTFEGAASVEPHGQKEAAARFHYFTGNDPANWRTMLPSYSQLQYAGLWEGVNLTLTGSDGGLKFLWTLKEAANFSAIRICYEGAEEICISEDGSLVIRHALGELLDPAPVAWQEIGGVKKPVDCAYVLEGNTASFAISGTYHANAPLYIDPILPYSTYLGGSSLDIGYAIAVDSQGFAYVGGATTSLDFPVTPGAFQTTLAANAAAFLTKFTPDGKSLVYSTYLSGSTLDTACNGVAVDAQLCAYLTGYTTTSDFPVTPGAFQPTFGGVFDAFVAKVSSDGASLLYSTYLGGNNYDMAQGISIDKQGCAYVTGETNSSDFPTTPGAFQPVKIGERSAFLSKLSQDGTSLAYSTYFNGSKVTLAFAVAVDNQGCAYMTGITSSTDLPVTPGVFQPLPGSEYPSFITKFSADGASLVYSSFLGGLNYSYGYAIAVDEAGNAVAAGITGSPNFPVTPGAFQTTYAGGDDAFITKVSPDGGSLIGSTYLGGSSYEYAQGAALDSRKNVYITGYTNSGNFPITPQVVPSFWHGDVDAFVSVFSPDLRRLLVSYYLGGSGIDEGLGIALGDDGSVYVTGRTDSANFPTTPGAFQPAIAGYVDAFATKEGFALLKKASISLQGMP